MDNKTRERILEFQRNEITEHHTYKRLAEFTDDPENKKVLLDIAGDELEHYSFWKSYTQEEVAPNHSRVWRYATVARILGLTFATKLMESREKDAQTEYSEVADVIPEVRKLIADEDEHEMQVLRLINDKYLKYVSSIILGLNDALVELTGALAGFTFALQHANLIAVAGFITGVAASFSMGASEYLSTKAEESEKSAFHASIYTGVAYFIVVLLLIAPYMLLSNVYISLAITLFVALVIIVGFSFYISVVQELSFKKQFLEMALLSLGVAAITFTIGYLVRNILGIEV
ncbi:MAG TPA: VIT1/CCC1 transporter family protein [Thermodesulfobacteriota bacterium]|nr:VIT1/CCC1 transporter family protein [Thermodesulfobacteriota bacterium]